MINRVSKLDWDSEFFGYPVGKFEIKNGAGLSDEEMKSFQLIYLMSDNELKEIPYGARLVDKKVRLTKKINPQSFTYHSPKTIKEYMGTVNEEILSLALESGIYSRFNIDKNFKNHEFKKMYTSWITSSIERKIADHVIVSESLFIEGFVTLKFEQNFGEIGLIAVSENSRGKGIGLALMQFAEMLVAKKGLERIDVVTQGVNNAALALYNKAGYKVNSEQYIYHFWNRNYQI